MSDKTRSFVFAAVMCFVCSILLTAASSGLKEFQQKNIAIDRHKNILKSVGLISEDKHYSSDDIEKLYAKSIKSVLVNETGRIIQPDPGLPNKGLPVYLYMKDNNVEAYILPIDTRGLWGMIYGYLAVKSDGSTIIGFTVYKHSETPGLGGEIEKRWFQKNFEGKQLFSKDGDFISVSVAKGSVKDSVPKEKQIHYIDGISGATLTGKFLTAGLKEILLEYEPVSVCFRKNQCAVIHNK